MNVKKALALRTDSVVQYGRTHVHLPLVAECVRTRRVVRQRRAIVREASEQLK
jgi:hypothetical protein